jgi:flavin reductase
MTTNEDFKLGMRRLASGVSLITTTDATGQRHGMIATSVVSVSAEPPTLLVCINKTASCHDPVAAAGFFCVNILGEENDEVATVFSSSRFRDIRFSQGEWQRLVTGAPALASGLASFDCRIRTSVEADSHTIFIASVEAVELWNNRINPLVYMNGSYARCIPAV